MLKQLTILIMIFFLFTFPLHGELKFEVAWQQKAEGGFSGPNEIRNPETGKTSGIIVCEVGKGIICFDPTGNPLWEYSLTPPVSASPAIADVDGDGAEDIVAGDAQGRVVLLDAAGHVKWTAFTPGSIQAKSCPAIADLDNDGHPEIVVGDISGHISCFDYQGKLRWRFQGEGTQMGPPLIADIYQTPGQEIIVTSHDHHIYVLSAQGEWLWDIYRADDLFPNSPPILVDIDANQVPELYIGGGLHHFYQINLKTGKLQLEKNVYLHVNDAICATDFDGDGKDEIVFGDKGGAARGFDDQGFAWKTTLKHTSLSNSPVALNLDADPDLEILFACKRLQIFNPDGTVLLENPLPARINSNLLAGDFDNDGKLEIIIAGHGMFGSNLIACLKWNIPYRENPLAWTAFNGNRAHSGRVPGARNYPALKWPELKRKPASASFRPTEKIQLLSGINKLRFDVHNPDQARLVLLTRIEYPNHSVHHFSRHILSREKRVSLALKIQDTGRYQISQQLVDAEQQIILAANAQEQYFEGAKTDENFLKDNLFRQTEAVLQTWQTTNPQVAEDFTSQLQTLKVEYAWCKSMPGTEPSKTISALIHSGKRVLKLARAGQALAPSGSFFAWEFCPWAYFHPHETLPSPENKTEHLSCELCVGEYESLALNITNLTTRSRDIRIITSDFTGNRKYPAIEHVEFRQAVLLSSIRREPIADALPKLNEAQIITLPALETRQLWITLNAKGMQPGDYVATLRLKSIEPFPTEIKLPLKMKVHAITLPRPRPLRFCVWSRAGQVPEYELQDQIDHGVTVHFGKLARAKCDSQGKLVGKIDFTVHDQVMKRLSPHGMIMLVGPQGSLRGQPFLSAPWRKAFVKYIRRWAAHIKELGLSYRDWAFYPYDEPSTPFSETTLNLVEVAQLIREADPNILIYADPTSGTTMESIKMLGDLLDIWCPSIELLERFGTEMLPAIRPKAKEIWFYDAAGRSRTLSPLGIYRWRFWYAWKMGFTGAGWWTYHYDNNVLWDGPNPSGDYFSSVYTAPGAIVTSKRWEAAREGVEDYELLYLLKTKIEMARQQKIQKNVFDEAEKLLKTLPLQVETTLQKTGRRIPITPDEVPVYSQATQTIQDARRQIISMILKLQNLLN